MTTLRVRGDKSAKHVNAVGAAIAGAIADDDGVRLRCMGANSVNCAVKAVIVANHYLSKKGKVISVTPRFSDQKNITVVIMQCEVRDSAKTES